MKIISFINAQKSFVVFRFIQVMQLNQRIDYDHIQYDIFHQHSNCILD